MTDRGLCMKILATDVGRRWCPNQADPASAAGRPRCADHLDKEQQR